MPQSLPDLESRRSQILLEIAQLGDFRRGSVHAAFRRCGKPNCACARDDHPGHGPQVRLSYKLRGKTVQKTLSDPAQVHKAEREVAAFRSFQQLSAELVEVNERMENRGAGSMLVGEAIEECKRRGHVGIEGKISSVDSDHFDKLKHFYEKLVVQLFCIDG